MDFRTLAYRTADRVAVITLDRPDRLNALSKRTLEEIDAALDQAESDTGVRVIVLTGAGKAFSSGFDLREQMEARPSGEADWREILDRDFRTTMRFWTSPKPTIAAVHGHCLAGAFEMALACDVTIAAEDAVFGEPELRFGAGIVTMILPWIVGPKQAKEIIFNGIDSIDAAEALRLGMVNRVVPTGTHLDAALAMARHLAVIDPGLLQETKRAINRGCEIQGMQEALDAALAIDLGIESRGSPDKQAFMEVARRDGLRAAIRWRDARFPPVANGS